MGYAHTVAVGPLELPFGAAQCLDHPVGKRGKEFVCQRGMSGEKLIAGIVLDFEKHHILLDDASAVAATPVYQPNLPEDAGRPKPRQQLLASRSVKTHVD
jgi:hypothetical protein